MFTSQRISRSCGVIILLLLLAACRPSSAVTTAQPTHFYYWKTKLSFDAHDRALADSLAVQTIYLRYFDVDWSPTLEMPVPVSDLRFPEWNEPTPLLANYDLVPVVYLTNRVFAQPATQIDTLAQRIAARIRTINEEVINQLTNPWIRDNNPAEITDQEALDSLAEQRKRAMTERMHTVQIDCDWTSTTRDAYFGFLRALQAAMPDQHISCTVRLHQYRDRKAAGIPPVNSGVLMCYNMAPVGDYGTENAVFSLPLLRGYLKAEPYPLPLVAALPLFGWGAVHHGQEFKGLVSDLVTVNPERMPFLKAASGARYRFGQDTVVAGILVREGDELRLDAPSADDLRAATKLLAQRTEITDLAFFDWNPQNIRHYHVASLQQAFAAAR